jgi:hypothetical protein
MASVRLLDNPEARSRSDETSEKIPRRIASADVSLDQDDLLVMPSIVFSGMH